MKTQINQKRIILLLIMLVIFSASISFAQDQPQWKVGDKVEILNLSKEWMPGTILGTVDWNGILMYRVKLDDDNAPNVYFNHTPVSEIRARDGQTIGEPTGKPTGDGNFQPNANFGAFKVGDLVDVYYNPKQGKNRGTIIEAKDGKFKIHYTGCMDYWNEWVDRMSVRPPATVSADTPEIKFLFTKWKLTKVGISSNNVAWGKAEGIQINGDGSYVWLQDSGKPPVKGKWITDAKVPGADSGTQNFDGILVKDAVGQEWKVFKWVVKGYPDGVEVQRMCSGEAIVGSRVQ